MKNITKEDLLQVLLETKEDKIELLTNVNSTILTIVGILSAVIIAYLGYNNRKLGVQVKKAEGLIKNLNEASISIQSDQEKINLILSTKEFQDKLNNFEKYIERLEESVRRWEEYEKFVTDKEAVETRNRAYNGFRDYTTIFEKNHYVKRMTMKEILVYEKIKSDESNLGRLDNATLVGYVDWMEEMYHKYHKENDEYPI